MPTMHNREVTTKEAIENILKTIMELHMKKGHAYVSEIADRLDMNLTTTYTVISQIAREGLILPMEGGRGRRARKQSMEFTPEGEKVAKTIFERHQTIQKWLNRLGIPMEEADLEACGIEHGMSDRTMMILKRHVQMATEITKGKPENAMKTMQQLMSSQDGENDIPEQTFSDMTIKLIDELGGIEGISRKRALIERANDEETLGKVLDFIDDAGGISLFMKKTDEYRTVLAFLDSMGGYDSFRETVELIDRIGGRESLENLCRVSEKYGGSDRLAQQAERQYDTWKEFFGKKK